LQERRNHLITSQTPYPSDQEFTENNLLDQILEEEEREASRNQSLYKMESATVVFVFVNAMTCLVYRQPSSRRKVFIHVKWSSIDKNVNQVRVYLQQCREGQFHNVNNCHFRWEHSQEESLSSIPITRNDIRRFYLSGLREEGKNPLYRFLVKYQVHNVEKLFYQYFTICGRGTNENALFRVLKVMKTYRQDRELDEVHNLFQSVYDQIRMNSSGNRVRNGGNKRKAIEKSTEVLYGQLSMTYDSLPIQQESRSESISTALPSAPAMPGSLTKEKNPNVSTVDENNAMFEDDVLDLEQLFLGFEDNSDLGDTLFSIMSNPMSTESEDINHG
jgi:hypothetical protein